MTIKRADLRMYQMMFPVGQEVVVTVHWRHTYATVPTTWQRVGYIQGLRRATQADATSIGASSGMLVVSVRCSAQTTDTAYPLDMYLDPAALVFCDGGIRCDVGAMTISIQRNEVTYGTPSGSAGDTVG